MSEHVGRTVKMFLVDGTASGIVTAEIMNWTGKIVVVPRPLLGKLSERPEANRTGVYVLVGNDPDRPEADKVYVGESDAVYDRLVQHEKKGEKESGREQFW